jgi:L-serine dehydratase
MTKIRFDSASDLIKQADKSTKTIGQLVIEQTKNSQLISSDEVIADMHKRIVIMEESIKKGLQNTGRTKSGLAGGDAVLLKKYKSAKQIISKTQLKALSYSFAIMEQNARFGKIVALPTAGSAGTVPGSLIAVFEDLNLNRDDLIDAFFTAGAVGILVASKASVAGAVGGCQAEVGTASAMAAAGLTQLRKGTPSQCFNAAAIALKGLLGLVCDPVAGLVECPCIKRNATAISNAFMASELTLAGVRSNIPFDEVVMAMNNVSKLMAQELKETAKGGLATTPTGEKIRRKLYS